MPYSVATTDAYDKRFEQALTYRLSYVGQNSAARLLRNQEKLESLLVEAPFSGISLRNCPRVFENDDLRWTTMDSYVAVYLADNAKKSVILLDLFYKSENWQARFGAE